MKHYNKEGTLRLNYPWGLTLGLASVIFLVYLSVGEALARTDMIRQTLTSPSLGSNHRGLEEQISRLETFAFNHESIDCIFLGDSTVQTDFVPRAFEQAYQKQTGEKIECFNFGIGATTVASSAALAKLLVNEFEPRLLIFGIHALNFTAPLDTAGAADLLETPWLRYKLGHLSVEGWLYEHSYLFRYHDVLKQLSMLDTNLDTILRQEQDDLPLGYYPAEGRGPFDLASPPDPDSKHPFDEHYFAALGEFQMLPINLEALDSIADLGKGNTQILAVEMPVSDTYHFYFGNGDQDYTAFIDEVDRRLSANSIIFWETSYLDIFPNDVWFNRNHLNTNGAELFSKWFGEQVGRAAQEGIITRLSG
jgi:hypothetical protein